MRREAHEAEIYEITGARSSHSVDLDRRISRYLVSMAIRTACVVLVFVVSGPLRWVCALGAVVLPYIAVLLANATDRRRSRPTPGRIELRGLSGNRTGPDRGGSTDTVLDGRIVAHPGPPPAA